METKICKKCEKSLTLDNFYYRENRNLYEVNCRKCNAKLAKEKRENKDVRDKMKLSRKKYYEKNKKRLNKINKIYQQNNKDRIKELQKQYYENNAEKLKKRAQLNRIHLKKQSLAGQLEKPSIKEKTCTKCNLTKDIKNFTYRKTRNIYESRCKNCNTIREKERRRLHKDKINSRRREIKKPLTIEQKITRSLRARLNIYIKNREGKNTYLRLLGCNKKFLIKWFEYNFELDHHFNMKWDNYGDNWHIDHVTPCASFDLKDEKKQKECFHWTNLSPVLKPYNLSKSDKIKPIDQIRQEIRVKNFQNTVE